MKYIKLLVLICAFFVVMVGCSSNKVQPDSTENVAWLMKLAIENNDYEAFDSLFSKGRKGSVSRTDFSEFTNLTTAGANYKKYELVTFENGEMLLVRLTPENEDNEYEIEDVIVVPEEMKVLFND
ncbi:hypothetical protein [Sutcliffiella sp. NC1]|uniref:hypothetical protein n=1 Tax=Sutcliffiella sp. NC1 TaxID=3004096 RepID=UPI0022DE8136|nr:hypothetical protein [Sutcliffiella sp. NC1]WBL17127.1 hypothetical protein O1A01_11045 [Sutcliffiella sp. NC1]